MPKILYVVGSLGLGGSESQVSLLILELVNRGWHCELFVLEPRGPLYHELETQGVAIHDGGYDSTAIHWHKAFLLGRALFRLTSLALRTRPDILHAYLPLTNFLGALAGRLTVVKTIITSRRALGKHQDRHPLWKPFDRFANLLSHHVTINSRAVGNDAIARDGINPKKLVLIPNGIYFAKFDSAITKRKTMRQSLGLSGKGLIGIVTVGNLIPYKGHIDLLHAIPKVVHNEPAVRFYLVGEDRGIGTRLKQEAEELGISQQVVFLGLRDDVPQILAGMDIFVMPSHEEGFSNALLEAMASGLAAVATDVGGNSEALEGGGELGFLIPAKDPTALADAILRLTTDPGLRKRLGRNAQQLVRKRYSVERMINAHIKLYQGKM